MAIQTAISDLRRRFSVVSENYEIAGRSYELIRPQSADGLISEEDFERDERLPYWADIWASSIVLAERVATESGGGRRLLELGCGVGLVSTAAASAGFDVTATDYYADALEFTCLNARYNGQTISATRLADWREFPEDLGQFDMVVASDVLYERANIPLVAAAFAATLSPTGLGLLTDPQRRHAATFPLECNRLGLQVVRTAALPIDFAAGRQTIDLLELRKC